MDTPPELMEFRKQIDAIDDRIIALLIERIGIVKQVGALKNKTAPRPCHIRAGREAEMVRRIAEKFKGTDFSPAAAAAMWRLLIGASTAAESPLALSVAVSDGQQDVYWMAREYFGPFLPIVKHIQVGRVIGDVMDGKSSVGVVPLPRGGEAAPWWPSLMQQGDKAPKIFAHIPFVHYGKPGKDSTGALAVANIAPEESGEDVSLIALETLPTVSQNKLQTLLTDAKFAAQWIDTATLSDRRAHLIELPGFITHDHAALKASLASHILHVHFLGAYAKPITLSS